MFIWNQANSLFLEPTSELCSSAISAIQCTSTSAIQRTPTSAIQCSTTKLRSSANSRLRRPSSNYCLCGTPSSPKLWGSSSDSKLWRTSSSSKLRSPASSGIQRATASEPIQKQCSRINDDHHHSCQWDLLRTNLVAHWHMSVLVLWGRMLCHLLSLRSTKRPIPVQPFDHKFEFTWRPLQ